MKKIPFCKPYIDEKEIEAVVETMKNGWLTQGPKVASFEKKFAKYVGAKHAVALNSCTSALFLALKYFKSKGEVIVPSLTFTASASQIVHNNMKPRFVDVNEETLCLDVDHVLEILEENPTIETIVPVHLTGNRFPIEKLPKHVNVIQDCAHYIEKDCMKDLGDNRVGCFSFYATKNMTCGEGGMLVTDNTKLYKWAKLMRLHGCNKDGYSRYKQMSSWEYVVEQCGYKMNMTDIAASIGLEQLRKLPALDQMRKQAVDRYNEKLGLDRKGLHLYPIFVRHRDKFMQYMLDNGIHCSVHFLALHNMPAYEGMCNELLPATEYISNHIVSLPLFPGITEEEVDYVAEKVLQSEYYTNDYEFIRYK